MKVQICNFCGKLFDDNDYINGGQIVDNLTGQDDFDICEGCYQKIMQVLLPHCKIPPFQGEFEDGDDENDNEDVN